MFRACINFIIPALILTFAFSSDAKDYQVWLEYPEGGVVLGQGYNLLEDRPATGTCVDFVPIQDPSQSVQYKFDSVTSQTQVQSITNISASGSMRMAILKASARLSFLSDENFTLNTEKYLLSATVVNSSLFAAPSIDFKKGGSVVSQSLGKDEAHIDYRSYNKISMKQESDRLNSEKCGQGFVAAIVSGASIDAFFTMSKSNASSLANIKAGLEADIGGIFTVSGSLEQKQTSNSIQQNTSVSAYKTGGNSTTIAFDIAGLKAAVSSMPVEAATAPKPIKIAVVAYDYLDNFPVQKSYTAQIYDQAIAGYFLARDVFQSTNSVIDSYEKMSEVPQANQPIYMKPISTYLDLNARAMKLTNQFSKALETCQRQVNQGNAALWADKETTVGIGDISKLLGVAPSDEGKRASYRSLSKVAELRANLDRQFAALTFAENSNSGDPTIQIVGVGNGVPSRLELCSPEGKDAFLNVAVDEAVALAAEEIRNRPIYLVDLGAQTREKLKPIAAEMVGGKTVEQMTVDVQPILQGYNELQRASLLLRDTCRKTYSHPLCSYDYKDFLDRAKLSVAAGDVNFPQLKIDLQ